MSEELAEIYPYKFKVVSLDNPPGRIYIGVYRTDNKDIGRDDRLPVKTIFDDMGKWEALTATGAIFLHEVGAINLPPTPLPQYSSKKYTFTDDSQVSRNEDKIGYYAGLSSEERKYREATEKPLPTVDEIASQLQNVPKWQSLHKVMNLLAPLWAKPGA